MTRLAPAALAAALLTSCGGPLLYAEVEIPHLQLILPRQSFPATGTALPANWCDLLGTNPNCVALTTSYDLAAQVPAFAQKGVTYELRLTDVAFTLSATQSTPGAPTDLSGIKSAVVRVGADPAVAGSGTVVAAYYRPTLPSPPSTIAVTGNANLDLAPYVASGGQLPVRVEVELDGTTSSFDADIAAAFYVRVTLDWGSYL